MTAPVQIDLSDEPADIGVGYGLPPWDDPDNFVLRVCEVRLLLSDAQIERLEFPCPDFLAAVRASRRASRRASSFAGVEQPGSSSILQRRGETVISPVS